MRPARYMLNMTDESKKKGDQRNIPPRIKRLRRVGFAILGLATAALTGPMLYGAFTGLAADRVWDPYTGELLSSQKEASEDCMAMARQLLMEAGRLKTIKPSWEEPLRTWTVRCDAEEFPETYRLLMDTRRDLQARTADVVTGEPAEQPPQE